MNIGEVLTRAWDIVWKNKVLWIFGLLASLAGGSGGNNFRYNFEQRSGTENFPASFPAWALILLVLLAVLVFVIFVILATLGRAGLVRGAWLADSGVGTEAGNRLHFGQLFRESQAYFWRVILLDILILGISLSLVLALVIPTVLTLGIAAICLWPLYCLLIPLFIVLTVIVQLAIISIVGENLGVMDSLRRAWEVFRANLAMMIAVGVIVAVASAVIGFLATLPLIAILAPAFVFFNVGASRVGIGALIAGILLFLIYLPILLFIQSLVTAYVETTWTVTFRRLTGHPAGSVIAPPAEASL